MSQIENKEAAKLKADIKEDTKSVFEKYLSISGWDVPENDEKASQELIVAHLHTKLTCRGDDKDLHTAVRVYFAHYRKAECGCFTGTCLRLCHHIVTL